MESSDLRVFEAVARLGSITAASDELHTVQSNVTARIRALENRLRKTGSRLGREWPAIPGERRRAVHRLVIQRDVTTCERFIDIRLTRRRG